MFMQVTIVLYCIVLYCIALYCTPLRCLHRPTEFRRLGIL